MHLVFLSHEYPLWGAGGVGTFIQTLGRALVEAGHSVSVVGSGKASKEIQLEDQGVLLYRLPKAPKGIPNFLWNAYKLRKKLTIIHQQNPIDIVESAENGLALVPKKTPFKKVIRLHGGHHFFAEADKRGLDPKKVTLEKRSFARADAFIGVSNYVKEHTEKYLSYNQKPIQIIPSPVSIPNQKIKKGVTKNQVLFAGTVCEKKGIRQLLEAFLWVRKQIPDATLVVYGRLNWTFPNGTSYLDYLKDELNQEHFENVDFKGSIPRTELFEKYTQAAVCVFPSHMETQGLVVMEAMAMKRPVIFSKYGPGNETIIHKTNGLLVDVYNPKDIAENILFCLQNPEAAEIMGKAGYDLVTTKYLVSKAVEENLKFYASIS